MSGVMCLGGGVLLATVFVHMLPEVKILFCLWFFLSAFLPNFFLCQDGLSGDVPPHLAQPCYVALGRALIWGLYKTCKPSSP